MEERKENALMLAYTGYKHTGEFEKAPQLVTGYTSRDQAGQWHR